MTMAPRELVFCNYNSRFWDGAVKVVREEIEVGDVYILGIACALEVILKLLKSESCPSM